MASSYYLDLKANSKGADKLVEPITFNESIQARAAQILAALAETLSDYQDLA